MITLKSPLYECSLTGWRSGDWGSDLMRLQLMEELPLQIRCRSSDMNVLLNLKL
jgi:hypothetical protein